MFALVRPGGGCCWALLVNLGLLAPGEGLAYAGLFFTLLLAKCLVVESRSPEKTRRTISYCTDGQRRVKDTKKNPSVWTQPWMGILNVPLKEGVLREPIHMTSSLVLRRLGEHEPKFELASNHFKSWQERNSAVQGSNNSNFLLRKLCLTYPVIECTGNEPSAHSVHTALALCSGSPRLLFSIADRTHPSSGYPQTTMWQEYTHFQFLGDQNPSQINHDDVQNIVSSLQLVFSKGEQELPSWIFKAMRNFILLDVMPDSTPFKFLGYFSLIEGILSHAPVKNESADSISRQLIRNIRLLSNRAASHGSNFGFSVFGGASEKTVLQKLYALRSSIAHGDDVTKNYDSLMSMTDQRENPIFNEWLTDWLRELTRCVIVAAVREPTLVEDLK